MLHAHSHGADANVLVAASRRINSSREVLRFMLLAFGLTWGIGGVGLAIGQLHPSIGLDSTNPFYFLAAYGPSVAALILTARVEGRSGVRALLSRLVPRVANVPWYLVVLVGFPLLTIGAASVVYSGFVGTLPSWQRLSLLLVLTLVADPGPVGEELGWRGFALPRILRFRSPLGAAVVLGLVWGLWHGPTFFISSLSQSHLSIPLFFVNTVALSIVMTWLFLRSAGDVFLMVLVHLMGNYCGAIGVPFPVGTAVEAAVALAIVAAGGLRQRNGSQP